MTDMTPKTCRLTGAALFLSLALNVFAAAYYFGGDMHHRPLADHRGNGGAFGMGKQLDQLTDPTRAKVQKVIDDYRPKLKAQIGETRKAHEAIDDALKEADYSRDKMNGLFRQLKAQSEKLQGMFQQMTLDIADQLSPEERAAFFNRPQKPDNGGAHDEWKEHGARHGKHANDTDDATTSDEPGGKKMEKAARQF